MRKNVVANFLGTAAIAASQLVSVPLYLRFLGPHEWGLVSIVLSWSSTLLLIETGISLSISRNFSELKHMSSGDALNYLKLTERRYLKAVAALAAVAVALIPIFNMLAPGITHQPGLPAALSLSLLLAAAQICGAPYRGALIGLGAQVRLNAIIGAFALLRNACAILLALRFPYMTAIAGAFIIISAMEAIVRRTATLQVTHRTHHISPATATPGHGAPTTSIALMCASIVGAAMAQSDRLYLSTAISPALFGVYSIAATLSLAALQLIYPVSLALIPRLPEFTDPERLNATLGRLYAAIAAVVAIAGLLVLLAGRNAMDLWLHDSRTSSAVFPLLLAHLAGTGVNAFSIPLHTRLLATHKDLGLLYASTAGLAFQLIFLAIFTHQLGAVAGAYAWIVGNVVQLTGFWISSRGFFRPIEPSIPHREGQSTENGSCRA